MTDTIDLVTKEFTAGHIEAVEFRIDIQVKAPVVDIIEACNRIRHLLLVCLIPMFICPSEEGTVCEVHTGHDIQITKGIKRGFDGNTMLDTVLPVACQTRMQDPILLHIIDLILHVTRVRQRDLLVPSLCASCLLSFEGIELRDGYCQRGQFDVQRRVAHILRQVERRVDAHVQAGESCIETNRRGTRRLRSRLGIIHRGEVVRVVTRRGEVHTGCERAYWMGLGVLTVVPRQFKVGTLIIIRHVLLACNSILVTHQETAVITIALSIVRRGCDSPGTLRIDLAQ